jgi:hypothetical protein
MFKVFLAFIFIFSIFFFGIQAVRNMTGKEMWSVTKLLTYSLFCAILTIATLISIVVIF